MFSKRTLANLVAIALVTGLLSHAIQAQSNLLSAKEHFERARSYSETGDPRAEQEYRRAIADRKGVYSKAWEGLGRYLESRLRFAEAANAWRKYLRQSSDKTSVPQERVRRLERAAQLKYRSDNGETLSIEEMLELIKLVDGFGSKGSAVPYAENAVRLYPQSAKALVVLAQLIARDQKDRALELLSRAIAFEPNDPSIYVARGGYHFWFGNPVDAEGDYRKAIELSEGRNASAWAGLGDSLARLGRRDEAIAAYRRYLSVRPKSAAHYDGEIRKSIELLENNTSKP